MTLTSEELHARLDRIATLIIHLLPGGWREADLNYQAMGTDPERFSLFGEMLQSGEYGYPIQRRGRLIPRSGLPELLRELRRDMYEPERGTWTHIGVTLRSGVDEPHWGARFSYPDESGRKPWGSPAGCAAELELFPRPSTAVPDWMARQCALHEAAVSFDPRTILAEPQPESDLVAALGPDSPKLFLLARLRLRRYTPEGAGRLLIGALAPGHWSLVRAEPAWLAVRCDDDGTCGEVVPFAAARNAVAHAMGGVMAEQNVEVNTAVLHDAGLLMPHQAPRKGLAAWQFGDDYGSTVAWRGESPRPAAEVAARNAYIALDQFSNVPYEYRVCPSGPPPETGPYVSVHEVFERVARNSLPEPRTRRRPTPEPQPEILAEGTEVDAYGGRDLPFVYSIGTPFTRRGMPGAPESHSYHVYRVVKPLSAYPGLFAPWPFHPDDDNPVRRPEDDWAGYYLVDPIETFVRSGHLVELTGPGGTPIEPADGEPT